MASNIDLHQSVKSDVIGINNLSCITRKTVFGVSDQARHRPDCTTTGDSERCLKFLIKEVEGL